MTLCPQSRFVPLLLTFFLMGCGTQKGPTTVPVNGIVMLEGEPLAEATVSFEPIDALDLQLTSQAVTDAEGKFQMQTYVGENEFKSGLQPGEYAITVIKLETVDDMRKRPKNLVPKKYSDVKSTPLKETVTESGNDFSIDLTK